MTAPETEVPENATYREVRELLRTFAASGWSAMTLRLDGMTIKAGRHGPPASAPPATPAAATPAAAPLTAQAAPPAAPTTAAPVAPSATAVAGDTTGCIPVRSPAIGSFWRAPSPGAAPFAEVGQAVAEGDQLAIVEVMKLMNPVLAPRAGEVAEVCAANADLVEYEQVLFWIRPSGG